ncbi:MAG: ABC transporter substrate-binding protein [Frankiaceae bacterium]
MSSWRLSRRSFLQVTGLAVAGAATACGGKGNPAQAAGPGPTTTFESPSTKLSGALKILLWSHFVPRHDTWFDPFAKDWGNRVGVDVSVDHINNADIPVRIAAEIQSGSGHDLIQYIAPLAQFEPSVLDLRDVTEEAEQRFGQQLPLCHRSSLNPTTNKFYAYAPGWVPDPGDYRASMWQKVGLPNGPSTWEQLLSGGMQIKSGQHTPVGIGMSQELDSNMVGRALLWSFGGAVQDVNENVTLNSPETVAAVEFMSRLYKQAMTDEVFSWNPASNNQGLIAGKLSYIVNSISAWRTAQGANPSVANDVFFVPALEGPRARLAAQHVMYNWIVPKFSSNADAAKEFLLHYTANFAAATYNSELYDFPGFPSRTPELGNWLTNDPFGAQPKDKLALLKNAVDWSTNIGHPGPSNTAIGEVFATFVIPNMYANAARGEKTPEQAVADAEQQVKAIFAKWRARGLVGGG